MSAGKELLLSAVRLREAFDYDPETGLFRRRFARGGRVAGSVAGSVNKGGYVHIGLAVLLVALILAVVFGVQP